MIEGIHVVEKKRGKKPSFWYVYAYRGGPQFCRHEGWSRPKLTVKELQALIAATTARTELVPAAPTLGDLIKDWQASPEWKNLTSNTRKTWGSAVSRIDEKWGTTPLSVWSDPRMKAKVVDWRDSRSDKPRAADTGVAVLRALLKFGQLRGRLAINVAEKIPQLYRNAARAEIVWTDDDMVRFAEAAREMGADHVNDGLRLAAVTGLRREDLVTLTWDEIQPDVIVKLAAKVSRGKRRKVVIPRLQAFDALLDELEHRHRDPQVKTILVNSFGESWTPDGFGGSFNRVRDKSKIVHTDPNTGSIMTKHLHDVRGTFCTKLITLGQLTDQQAAGIMGWSPDKVAGIRRTYVDQGAVNVAIAARLRSSL